MPWRNDLPRERSAPQAARRTFGGRGNSDFLPCLDAVARRRLLAVNAQQARPRPARDHVEADLRHVPLEPAVEPDAVVIFGNFESTGVAHRTADSESYASRPAQNSNAWLWIFLISFAAFGPSHRPVYPCFFAPPIHQPCPGSPSDCRTTSTASSGSPRSSAS